MASQADPIVRSIRALSAVIGAAQSDAELVEHFVQRRDEAAFEALLKRHGPMIMRLCRRLLRSEQDAEDVFQATFLMLARKAAAVRRTGSIGPWLYGVAYRIALKCRSARRRLERSRELPDLVCGADVLERLSVLEAERLLLEELAGLPSRYRDPLVLCYLQGKTRDEAASALGCALGTLKDRLHRGKELLHRRLKRRGVSLSAAMLAGLFSESSASIALSAELVTTTIQVAVMPGLRVPGPIAMLASAGAGAGRMKLAVGMMAATMLCGFAAGIANLVAAAQTGKEIAKEIVAADPSPSAEPVEQKSKRLDSLGDPLPDGAVMRLGTRRHRVQTWPLNWQSMPDGKSYLSVQRLGVSSEARRSDSHSGLVVEKWPVPNQLDVVGFSPNGRFLLLTNHFIFRTGLLLQGQDEPRQEWRFTLYDLSRRKEVWSARQMLAHKDWADVGVCRFAPSGKWIATAGQRGSGTLRLWDAENGKQLWQHPGEGQSLSLLGFADGEKLLAVRGNNDGHVYLFDRATGKQVRSFATAPTREYPGGGLLSPDGSHIVIGGWNPRPRLWDLAGKEQAPLEGHTEWARQLAFSPDGKKLYTGGNDSFVLERAWPSGKVLRRIDLGRMGISELAVSGDGRRLEILFWGEKALAFFDLETGKRIPEPIDGHRSTIYGIGCAPDGSLITFASDATVRTWDAKAGKAIAQFKVELDLNAGGFALSADGKRVAVPKGDIDGVHVYERATGKLLSTIPADHWSMKKLTFSPDGRFLAAIDTERGMAQVWATDTSQQVLKFKAQQVAYGSTAGAFSPDGRTFAFTDHGLVRFWNTATWKEAPGITASSPFGILFSPDGRMLATLSVEGVRLFEVSTRLEREHLRPAGYPSGSLCFSRSGRFLAWVSDRTKIVVLDVRRGILMGPFAGHDDTVSGLTFTLDEKALASSSADSTILIWDIARIAEKNPAQGADADRAWQALASGDARAAFAGIRTLAANPEQALRRIGERVKPVEPLDSDWVATRLHALDSAKFAEREQATRDLEQVGERVVPFLEKLLQGQPGVEARERAERLLAKLRGPVDDQGRLIQSRRGLEVLEWIGTNSARDLVEVLASGAEGAPLTTDAKNALGRWRQ
jgi:RNA polymerase sigma factor (sigma-70 family)